MGKLEFKIPEGSIFSYAWNIAMTVILAFYVIMFPMESYSEPTLETNFIYIMLNIGFEWFFMIDIMVNFITVFRDKYDNLVKRSKFIA